MIKLPPSPLNSTPPSDKEPPDLTKAPGHRIRGLYKQVPPFRPMLDHLGLHQLAQDRAADWLECEDDEERMEIAKKYRHEFALATSWAVPALIVETLVHTGIAKGGLMLVDSATTAFDTLTRYPWQSALVIGLGVTLLHRYRKKK